MTSSASLQTLRDGIAVPTFPLSLAWLACTRSSLRNPEWVCCPFSHAASAAAFFSVAADVAPVHQVRNILHQHRCVGRDSSPTAMLQRSPCSGLTGHESYRTFDDPFCLASSTGGLSLEQAGFPPGVLVRFPLPTLQSLARCHT